MKDNGVLTIFALCVAAFLVVPLSSLGADDTTLVRKEGERDGILRIYGGEQATAAQWPWIAALIIQNAKPKEGHYCAGSLVRTKWVLTSAHCVTDSTTGEVNAIAPDVLLGATDLSKSSGERIAVKRIIRHPGYNPFTNDNDIALLELKSATTKSRVALTGPSFGNRLVTKDQKATAAGWGLTSPVSDNATTKLMQADLPIVSYADCSTSMFMPITDNMFCAGYLDGEKGVCSGDSGGPLVVYAGKTKILAGVISYNPWDGVCGQSGYSVFTDLSKYADWIDSYTCTSADIPQTPSLNVFVEGNLVAVFWSKTTGAGGYRLYYTTYPEPSLVKNIDVGTNTSYFAYLPAGSGYSVAVQAYKETCNSRLSSISSFIVP